MYTGPGPQQSGSMFTRMPSQNSLLMKLQTTYVPARQLAYKDTKCS